MATAAEELIDALRAEGLRITAARRSICDVLAAAEGAHLSAADIVERARAGTGPRIDQSTVYRTLDVLEGLGYLHHVHLGHGPGVFHLTRREGHHHLYCERCGRTCDVPLDEITPVLDAIAARHGFTVRGVHFALTGLCRDCEPSQSALG